VKNCDQGLENAALAPWPRAAWTDPEMTTNINKPNATNVK